MTAHATDFDGFYQRHYGATVAMTYGFTADLAESQDIAQEAFCRAWQRWKVISRYEQPASWVRRVATNLALSRWRKLRVASAYLARQHQADLPELTPDHVDLMAALRLLPVAQRKALVLHYLVDLPIAEVAAELGVSDGTVKGWLHRGRHTLAAELGDEVRRAASPPPAPELRVRADRRRLRRSIVTAAAAFLAVVIVVTGFQLLGRAGGQPMPPASPNPSVSVDPSPSPSRIVAPAKPAPLAPTSCRVEQLPLPKGHGPASHLSGGDPTGRFLLGSSNDTNIYIWDNGKLVATPTLEGIDDSQLTDINSAGVAVGYSLDQNSATIPWLYRDGKFVRLPGGYAEPTAINEQNVIVGTTGNLPVIWRTPESQPELLSLPEKYFSAAHVEISEEGLVVVTAESASRSRGPNRAFVYYPDGTHIELAQPPLTADYVEWAATRIRGDWVAGGAFLNGKHVTLRWNLRTGKSDAFPELGGSVVVNEHGWLAAAQPRPVIRTDKGEQIPLPTNIPNVSEDGNYEAVYVFGDDGRSAAGELAIRSGDNVAVRWVCQ
ncbi:hypothetical protein Rhe02_77440 [Rhizocola hellebori]|uniref:Sigma-70 family RNA polymerase sigma factor n=1 Tax=Rhizocola hellebori TaxID=1392758 RepID=A0A8J3QGK3_9ACTN|nr:SigE family RNA polymerase sigma factor [Rhizocola hellebori]GIH09677.1 hypothetical protein Rhe02_77440 [Rhizocola hellebori]